MYFFLFRLKIQLQQISNKHAEVVPSHTPILFSLIIIIIIIICIYVFFQYDDELCACVCVCVWKREMPPPQIPCEKHHKTCLANSDTDFHHLRILFFHIGLRCHPHRMYHALVKGFEPTSFPIFSIYIYIFLRVFVFYLE
jgi:hypothetical protein